MGRGGDMRRLILCVLLGLALPATSFAGVGIGLAVYSDTPIFAADDVNSDLLDGTASLGANGRIKFNSLNLDALALYAQAEESLDLYLTAQLSHDLSIFRLSGGVGPAIRFPFADELHPTEDLSIDWLNAKIDFDVLIGRITVGLGFQYLVPSTEASAIDFSRARGRIGATIVLW